MSLWSAVRIARAPSVGLAAVGVFWGTFAASVPDLKAAVSASDAEFGTAMMMAAIGGIAAMTASPWIMSRLGRRALPVGAILLAVAFLYPVLPAGPIGFGVAMIGVGASLSLLDIGANIRISVLEARHGLHLMNFGHAMFSLAFAASAMAASLARKAGFGPGAVMPVMMLVVAVLALAMIERGDWRGADAAPEGSDRRRPWAPILYTAGILLAAFVSENAAETWSALHIERTLGGAVGEGGFGPVALGLTMGIGRLAGQTVASLLGEARLVLWSSLVGIVGAVVIAVAPVAFVAVAGVGLLGLGVAVTVPSANSLLGRLVRPDQRAHAISRAWMIGFTGFFIGPTAMGFIAETAGLRAAFLTVALVMATIVPSVFALTRQGR